jgi:2,3-bisphosphoglycerate-independent phosphoglycerate mutase
MPTSDLSAAAHTIAHCDECASTVYDDHRPGNVMAIEVEHSTPCPAWPHDQREVAMVLYGKGAASDE